MFFSRKSFQDGIVKAAVFGADDGIITTFAIVTGVSGAHLPHQVILILGIANMIADAISMGLGDFLGEVSERKYKASTKGNNTSHLSTLGLTSLITFVAFVTAGTLPLLPYIVGFVFNISFANPLLLSTLSTGFALLLVGGLRTIFIKGSLWRNSLQMFLIGAIAASASYFLGFFIRKTIGYPL